MLVKEVAVDIFFFNRPFCLLGSKIISLSSQVNFKKLTQHLQRLHCSFFTLDHTHLMWRCGGLMVSALDSGSNGPGSSPGQGHCVVFSGKTIYSHSASLHPGVQMGTSKYTGGSPVMDWHPIQGGVAILLATSY